MYSIYYPVGMPMTEHLAPQLRTDLLCHLVVMQLLARANTDGWAGADRLVEVIRAWSRDNVISIDWFESARLAHLSQQLATVLWMLEPLRSAGRLTKLFAVDWRLDNESPIVRKIRDVCTACLMRWT